MFEWNNSEYLANVPQAISSGSRSRLPASNASTSMNTAGRTLARGGMVQRALYTINAKNIAAPITVFRTYRG